MLKFAELYEIKALLHDCLHWWTANSAYGGRDKALRLAFKYLEFVQSALLGFNPYWMVMAGRSAHSGLGRLWSLRVPQPWSVGSPVPQLQALHSAYLFDIIKNVSLCLSVLYRFKHVGLATAALRECLKLNFQEFTALVVAHPFTHAARRTLLEEKSRYDVHRAKWYHVL